MAPGHFTVLPTLSHCYRYGQQVNLISGGASQIKAVHVVFPFRKSFFCKINVVDWDWCVVLECSRLENNLLPDKPILAGNRGWKQVLGAW